MNSLKQVTKRLIADLNGLNQKFCFVGALAIGARGRVRQTIDADLALFIDKNQDPSQLIDSLINIGYGLNNVYKKKDSKKVSLIRLFAPESDNRLIELDFLISLCGIENEVVESAEVLEIWPGILAPIASMPSLIAMKARCQDLPERIQDKADLINLLLPFASEKDISSAKTMIKLMQERGFGDGRNIIMSFEKLLEEFNR